MLHISLLYLLTNRCWSVGIKCSGRGLCAAWALGYPQGAGCRVPSTSAWAPVCQPSIPALPYLAVRLALNTILYTQLFFFLIFKLLFLIISIQVDFKFCELTDFWFYLSLSLWYLACVRSSVSIYRMGAY